MFKEVVDIIYNDYYRFRFNNLVNAISNFEIVHERSEIKQTPIIFKLKEVTMNVPAENIKPPEINDDLLPLIVAFRKNMTSIIDDHAKKYISYLDDIGLCRFNLLDSLSGLPQALSDRPQCLLFYASGLFDQHTSITEFIMMLKSMIHFTTPDHTIKIGFVIDQQTPYSFIKELQKANIVGVVPTLGAWGESETTKGLEALINGIPYWPKHLIEQLPGNTPKPRREAVHLTHRQQEVLELIANRGLTNKQIARVLNISESTVKIHVSAIMKAYCVRNRTQLALTKK